MNAHQQVVEFNVAVPQNDDLAIKDELLLRQCGHGSHNLGKVSAQWLPCFGLQRDFAAVAKHETAKAVPLGLVLPSLAARDLIDELRFHGRIRWTDWQV